MPEQIADKKIFTLFEVCSSIRKTIENRYTSSFWVSAEMNKLNHYRHSGHCYPELLEKQNGKVLAELRSILWKADYDRINNRFLDVLNEPLKDGIKVLLLVNIQYDPQYGLSLRIKDIDPSFTLGELEREKAASIQLLKELEIFDKNKSLAIPLLPQRIAIISVETSKGYADFLRVIDKNSYGFKFFHMLFPALLQGEKSINSILNQLDRIEKVKSHFDIVTIIRGGGGDVGLSSYNNFELSKRIAEYPLPVITGVGHSTNFTVAEMVAFHNGITPTAVGEWLIERFLVFQQPIILMEKYLQYNPNQILQLNKNQLFQSIRFLESIIKNKTNEAYANIKFIEKGIPRKVNQIIQRQKTELKYYQKNLHYSWSRNVKSTQQNLQFLASALNRSATKLLQGKSQDLINVETLIKNHSPQYILKKGFSITYKNNMVIKSVTELKVGDEIHSELSDGVQVYSKITKINN